MLDQWSNSKWSWHEIVWNLKATPVMKSDPSHIQGLQDGMYQDIAILILENKVCCKNVQHGVQGLISLVDMCDHKMDERVIKQEVMTMLVGKNHIREHDTRIQPILNGWT